MTQFTLNAQARSDLGKGASRRLRRNDAMIPAVIYGAGKDAISLSLLAKEVAKLLEDQAVFSEGLSLVIDGAAEKVSIKAIQRHPSKGVALHIDFLRA